MLKKLICRIIGHDPVYWDYKKVMEHNVMGSVWTPFTCARCGHVEEPFPAPLSPPPALKELFADAGMMHLAAPLKCTWLEGDRCQHVNAKVHNGQLPCVFKMHDARITACRYKEEPPVNLYSNTKCDKPNCVGVLNCDKCNWQGNKDVTLKEIKSIVTVSLVEDDTYPFPTVHPTHSMQRSVLSNRDEYCVRCGIGNDNPSGLKTPCHMAD